jgi:hypothetical protein
MRRTWFDYVAKIRKKGNRGKKTMGHAEAMKLASKTWPKEKKRLERKLIRDKKLSDAKPPVEKKCSPLVEKTSESSV